MDKVQNLLLIIAILFILLAGFSITINEFNWEFKGLIRMIFKLIYGKDL